jgi:hypothetical protein
MYTAALLADRLAESGVITPNVLSMGAELELLGFRHPESITMKIEAPARHQVDWFKDLKNLWRVHDHFEAVMAAKRGKQDEKVVKAPSAYRCAAEGCGIEAKKKAGLLKCAGKCPIELKPSYCSKACQVKVSRCLVRPYMLPMTMIGLEAAQAYLQTREKARGE